jgi:hypothetical protein
LAQLNIRLSNQQAVSDLCIHIHYHPLPPINSIA